MSISNALNNALSGLRANGRLADVTAGNLANALTPGYGRQSVDLAASVTGTQGTGVRVSGIARALDPELSAARRMADGDLAERTATSQGLVTLERAIGGLGDADSLGARLAAFERALLQLGETPESAPRQTAAAEAARDLATAFNDAAGATLRLRQETDIAIGRTVAETNAALDEIARLNRRIQVATAAGRETAPLIDERERQIDRVAQALPIREVRRDDGVVELMTREGIGLVDIRAQQLDYSVTPVYEPGLALGGPGTVSGLSLRGIDVTPGAGGPQRIEGGRLAGLFALRDRIAPEIEARLDGLAADLAARLGDPALDPTLAAGDPGLFTDGAGAFALANTTGFAARVALNPAVDPATGGDPARIRDGINAGAPGPASDDTIIRALADALAAETDAALPPAVPGISGRLSLAGRIDAVVEILATDRVVEEAEVAALGTAREALATEEATALGVDTDDELARLIQIEQAYAANAQVIQTAARMLDELRRIQ